MDETSLTLGWLVGRRIAGQRTKKETEEETESTEQSDLIPVYE